MRHGPCKNCGGYCPNGYRVMRHCTYCGARATRSQLWTAVALDILMAGLSLAFIILILYLLFHGHS